MNKETIIKAKEHYEILMSSMNELKEIRDFFKHKNISEDDIIKYSFHEVIDINSECNIYVFRGAYRIKNNNKAIEVSNYDKAHYFIYFNLEHIQTGVVIYPQEFADFEKNNIILRFNDNYNFNNKFQDLQCSYYKEYLTNPAISENKVLEKLKKSCRGSYEYRRNKSS